MGNHAKQGRRTCDAARELRYQELLRRGPELLRQLNPGGATTTLSGMHCPATADAVDDYLNEGNATALCVDDLTNGFHIRGRSRRASLRQIVHSLRSSGCSAHVVVRGNREGSEQFGNTPHFFVIAFIGGTAYIIDAYLHEVNTDLDEYYERQEFRSLDVFDSFETAEDRDDVLSPSECPPR